MVIVNGGTVTGGTPYFNNNNEGTIIAWDNPSGSKTYKAFTSDDITKLPSTATAVWKNKDGKAGIDYANGTKTGFIELGVTVSKATPDATFPTSTPITYGAALSTSILSGETITTPGTFAWTNGTEIPTVTNYGYEVTFTPTDTENYNTLTETVAINVAKAPEHSPTTRQ